eukprot:5580236-Amphidinium_carterae.1
MKDVSRSTYLVEASSSRDGAKPHLQRHEGAGSRRSGSRLAESWTVRNDTQCGHLLGIPLMFEACSNASLWMGTAATLKAVYFATQYVSAIQLVQRLP